MENYAPILVFVYNRLNHTQKLIYSLLQNELSSKSELFIYSDGIKGEDATAVKEVRNYIHQIKGFKKITIIERETNWGLARNIIEGVTECIHLFGEVIVLEDDLVVSNHFIAFMNDALNTYRNNENIGHIHACAFFDDGTLPDTFLIKWVGSWGWSTWERAWQYFNPDGASLLQQLEAEKRTKEFDFNNTYGYTRMLRKQIAGINHSWAIRWNATLFLRNMLSVNAGKSLVLNEGFDGSGTHCDNGGLSSSLLYNQKITVKEIIPSVEDKKARKVMIRYYQRTNSFKAKLIRKIKTIIHFK